MKTNFETGHATNVAHFKEMLPFIDGFGGNYNPTQPNLTQAAIHSTAVQADAMLASYGTALTAYKNALAIRELAFSTLGRTVTRVLNAVRASHPDKPILDNIRFYGRRLHGERATPKLTDEEKKALTEQGKSTKEISTSHMGFESRVDNFEQLIILLSSLPQYHPNEPDLSIAGLNTYCAELKSQNAAVASAEAALAGSRISRNDFLYKSGTGLVDTALEIKLYVKSLFGATSPQYNEIKSILFKKQM